MGYIIGLGLMFAITFGAVLPSVINSQFQAFVRSNYSSAESVKISYLETAPASIITGQLNEVDIKVNKVMIGELPVSAVDIVARPVMFNAMDVVFNKTLNLTAPSQARIQIMITDSDFRRMFENTAVIQKLSSIETSLSIMPAENPEKQVISILKPIISIQKNGLRADFILQKKDEPDTAVPITIQAMIEIHGDNKILDIHVTSISVDGMELPESLAETIGASLNPILNLSQYDTKDMKIKFTKFTPYDGYLVLEGNTTISSLK